MKAKKIKVARYSGLPVSVADLTAYKQEFETEYDKAAAKHGPDMLSLQQELAQLDKTLSAKYNLVETVEPPKSKKAWKQLIDKYECPIMVARGMEDPEQLIFVLMDQPFT